MRCEDLRCDEKDSRSPGGIVDEDIVVKNL